MRTLIVDDSVVIRSIIKSLLAESDEFEIIGEASNGESAVVMVEKLKPDLVLMDINMPVMDGLEATRIIMKEYPVPVCIFSSEVDSDMAVRAMGIGAIDAIRKPDLEKMNNPLFLAELLERLKGLSRARFSRPGNSGMHEIPRQSGTYRAVVMGASTGGPAALKTLLAGIPADFPLGIALVQHIEERFVSSFTAWLNSQTALKVRTASDGDSFIPGTVLIAPGAAHLVCREGTLFLDDGPRVRNQKPAVDRLFQTSGTWFKNNLVAVLLTGMGADGADGCLEIIRNGGHTIIQNEQSCAIFGMPKAAIDQGGASVVLPLEKIGGYLADLAGVSG